MKIWKPVMQKYFQQIPRTVFNQPPRKIQVGEQVRVPNLSGLSLAAATRKLERLGFTVEKQYVYSDTVPKYGFMGWSPGSGDWISEFGTIYAVYSSGRDPAVVAAEKAEAKKKAEQKKKQQQQQNAHADAAADLPATPLAVTYARAPALTQLPIGCSVSARRYVSISISVALARSSERQANLRSVAVSQTVGA